MSDSNDTPGGVRSDTGPFAIIPAWLFREVSGRAVQIYGLLALHADKGGRSWPSRRTLAVEADASPATIDRALGELVEAGALLIEPRFSDGGHRTSNLYTVLRLRRGGHTDEEGGSPIGDEAELDPDRTREETSNEVSSIATPSSNGPPAVVKIDGRNLGFDALAEACLVHDKSPRRKSIGPALASIREQAWAEVEFGKEHGPEAFERWLAQRIHDRADLYRRKMPTVHLTPTALAKWWTDLPAMPDPRDGRSGSAADALSIAEAAVREARGQRGDP